MEKKAEALPYHYQLIRRMIETIDGSDRTLSLGEMADFAGLSEAHFQRVFTRWAGISPIKYQQFLRLSYAKTLLAERFTTLQTAEYAGLSSGGRLHDLFLRWEAMRPGEYAKRGAGLTIRYGWFDSPFGKALVMVTYHGICGIGFATEHEEELVLADMLKRWPHAKFVEAPRSISAQALAAFTPQSPLSLHLIGGAFQIKVWEALLAIPTSYVTTYSQIAAKIGSPKATRAVGTAIGRNPIAWLIPCHRVLRISGGLGGYHWGLPAKRAMLAFEHAKIANFE